MRPNTELSIELVKRLDDNALHQQIELSRIRSNQATDPAWKESHLQVALAAEAEEVKRENFQRAQAENAWKREQDKRAEREYDEQWLSDDAFWAKYGKGND